MKKAIKIMLVFLSFSFIAQSQTAVKSRGDKSFKEKDYVKAIEEYNETSKYHKLNNIQLLNLANSYYNIREFKSASKEYMSHLHNGDTLSLTEYNKYIQSLKLSDYSQAVVTSAIDARLNLLPKSVIKRYKNLRADIKREKLFSRTTNSYSLKNLDINSSNSDFGITVFPDSTVMYSSSKENKNYSEIYKKIKQPFINIYKTKLKNNSIIDTSRTEKYVEKSMMHSSSPSYDSLYNRLFYTQSEKENNKLKFNNTKSNFRIVYGFVDENKKIEDVYYYPKKTNGYNYGHPFFDKKTKRLYFVSDRPGGFGGTDIYYVEMNAEGVSSSPVNLGEKVNSFGNEMFPSILGNQIYFSSDLFIGNGGLDVYSSKISNNKYEEPTLLEEPINSSADDFAYQIVKSNKTEKEGYFSSNRNDGKGSDDIYAFTESKIIKKIVVSGFTLQKGKDPINIIPNATITVSKIKGGIVKTIESDKLGRYTVLLPIDYNYVFKAEKKGYTSAVDTIILANITNINPISKDFYLEKELVKERNGEVRINLKTVYFKFDDARITPKAEKQLQFALDYLIKYPTDKFKLEAHTDSRGKKSYNLKLSIKRSKSVHAYLLSKGISPDRVISVKGYGEEELINKCKNNVKCTDKQHEQNRRTVFIVMRKKKD